MTLSDGDDATSVRKPEVQPPTPAKLGAADVVVLFLLCHSSPNLLTLPVPPHVVGFRQQEDSNDDKVDDD